jgi:OmpA-OmpF porin, OOP family
MQKRTMMLAILVFFAGLAWGQDAPQPEQEKKAKKAKEPKEVKEPKVKEEKTKEEPKRSSLAIPKNMFEIGLNPGLSFVGGDVTPIYNPGQAWAAGLHLRKSLDYVFSLRADFLYANMAGENPATNVLREFETVWTSGTIYGVMNLNSLRWDKPVRKTNLYVMVGAGVNRYEVKRYTNETVRDAVLPVDNDLHMGAGTGLNFRVSPKFNVGLETQAFMNFGKRADLLDGSANYLGGSAFRDIASFTNLSLNFNIGNASSKSEPLYWINPMDGVMQEIEGLKQRGDTALEDKDEDGVIDAVDQDLNTPPGAMVDTKGRTLDSDRDGVPDHVDKEPFYTPQANEKVDESGVVVNPTGGPGGRGGVTEERVKELIDQALQNYQVAGSSPQGGGSVAEWFLPMLHFPNSSSVIKYSDYGNLAGVARMMKSNPAIRLSVIGFTDATGNESVNNQLSYDRAKNVIEHMVTNHGVARGRFVLQWKGSADNLVPANSSYMNRRVEFKIAGPGDVEMDVPAPTGTGDKY